MEIPMDAFIVVDDMYYKQHILDKPEVGMLVLDTKDNMVGYIDLIHDESRVAVKHSIVVELGIPITRLRELKHTIPPNTKN